jgi:hypothetical protein
MALYYQEMQVSFRGEWVLVEVLTYMQLLWNKKCLILDFGNEKECIGLIEGSRSKINKFIKAMKSPYMYLFFKLGAFMHVMRS